MSTSERRHLFADYLAGRLSPERSADLERALLEDETLLAEFDAFAQGEGGGLPVDATVESAVKLAPPEDFTDSVRQRIRRRSGGRFFQEDRVNSRYIPIFIVVAFLLLAVVAVSSRWSSFRGAEVETVEPVEAEDMPAVQEGPRRIDRIDGAQRIQDRPYRAEIRVEDDMRAASDSVHYRDLPVSGRPTFANVTYTRNMVFLESPKDAEGLRADIEKLFGERELVEGDGYFTLMFRERDYAGVHERLGMMDGVVKEESRQVSLEELEEPSVRFYYQTSP